MEKSKIFQTLTIICFGIFIGFLIGYHIFAQIHLKIVCQPSGNVLLDTKRGLRHEIIFDVDVRGCEGINLVVDRPGFIDQITSSGKTQNLNESRPSDGRSSGSEKETASESSKVEIPTPPINKTSITEPYEPTNATKTVTLEIFDICTGKIDVNAQLLEGLQWCLNRKYPYYIILEKNTTHIKTSFYDGGFNETYEMSNSTLIFRFFAQDVSLVGGSIQAVEIYGVYKDYFSIGTYSIDNIWKLDPVTGIMEISKTVIGIPLSVNQNVPTTNDWTSLKFYLRTTVDLYYIGEIWFFVIS